MSRRTDISTDHTQPRVLRGRGFTLLELLLAVTLVGLIAAMTAGLLRSGVNARRVAHATVDESRTLRLALDQIARPLASALPPTGLLAGEFLATDDGSDEELSFHAAVDPSGAFGGDVVKLRYRLDRTSYSSPCLVRESTRNLLATTEPEPETTVLCRSVQAFECDYYDGASWLDEWDSTLKSNALPTAVRITLTLVDADDTDARPAASLTRVVTLPCATGQQEAGE